MTQPQNCLRRIQQEYDSFSKTEKKIADYVIAAPDSFVHKTIDEVAGELNIAISSVFRFTKTMGGYKGYQAMKIAIVSEISDSVKGIVEDQIEELDDEENITEKIFNQNIRMFKESIKVMDFGLIKKSVQYMLNAGQVHFYGFGSSSIVALDAQHKFMDSGLNTASYSDLHMQLKAATMLRKDDVAILISQSSSEEQFNKVLDEVKATEAKVIVITNKSNAKLQKKADVVLKTTTMNYSENDPNETISRIVQLSLIDSIYANVMSSKDNVVKQTFGKLKNYLVKE
ncbi:sialic acid utilization regulator [Gracilibacillus boraciitolerans JCM 21714]|uniref:Sialic acid utilization regulator n=1 Tax=Gracilibacillus boraciitolerans JCM 21714 TaxID=1298598 RepID=W4VHC0_9BACI|nr:sialic acid utilization regulator [Gracilibacillus boraciitolerans JCM 21714]